MNCTYCNKPTSNPKFCSKSCSAKLNNKLFPKRKLKERLCSICGEDNQTKFPINTSSTCKLCKSRQRFNNHNASNTKQICIDYKGGKCQSCGYNKCSAALDFHHNDPTKKAFELSTRIRDLRKCINLPQDLLDELEKCILLCSNCHRELHYELHKRKGKESNLRPANPAIVFETTWG